MQTDKIAIVIPTLDPDSDFPKYCRSLIDSGVDRLIIVDDGSGDKQYFDFAGEEENAGKVVLLRHYVNLGKGRALKNAINYFMNMPDVDDFCGMITVDSDGQHSLEDVLKCREALIQNPDRLILGARDFDSGNVPFKSALGNRTTRILFRLLHGAKLQDTQTGLRGIPTKIAPYYIDLFGERFEYEMNMLIFTARKNIPITEVPIRTIYLNKNAGTHFRPIRDSIAIYGLLLATFLHFILASLSSFVLDIAVFKLILYWSAGFISTQTQQIFLATITARVLSSIYNFLINRNVVFHSRKNQIVTLLEYYALCIVQMMLSASLVSLVVNALGIPETIVKIIVDSLLFLISFHVQRKIIFREDVS